MGSAASGFCCCTSALNQLGYGVAQLRAFFLPVSNTSQLQTQTLLTFSSQRIVETHALDETTVATIARISHYYVEERTVLGAAARHTNDNHSQKPNNCLSGKCQRARILRHLTEKRQAQEQHSRTMANSLATKGFCRCTAAPRPRRLMPPDSAGALTLSAALPYSAPACRSATPS